MNFKDLLLESIIEEGNDFGVIPERGKVVNRIKNGKQEVLTILSVKGNTVKFTNGDTATLENGHLPVDEFSKGGEVARESKKCGGGKKKVISEAVGSVSFDLSFSSSNAAVVDDPEYEISRILKNVSLKISNGFTSGAVIDSNGNKIGKFDLTIEEDTELTKTLRDMEDDELEEAKCKGCKCGTKLKPVNGECPECGAVITEAKDRASFGIVLPSGTKIQVENDSERKKAGQVIKKYVEANPTAGDKALMKLATLAIKMTGETVGNIIKTYDAIMTDKYKEYVSVMK